MLSTQMDMLISPAQTAFSKSRCIHDSYLYLCNTVCSPHWKKKPALLLKIDIARAFDSVSSEYLFELMQAIGFSTRWTDLLACLLSSSLSVFLLNGTRGELIRHRRGLGQDDPLSPFLFIMAIDPSTKFCRRRRRMVSLLRCQLERPSCGLASTWMMLSCSRTQTDTRLKPFCQ
jgi:hypothetical protein